jgi:hypothetical protein
MTNRGQLFFVQGSSRISSFRPRTSPLHRDTECLTAAYSFSFGLARRICSVRFLVGAFLR